jgi:hypothetical protein
MVVQIEVCRFAGFRVPDENQTPLVVDTDCVVVMELSGEFFKMIAGWTPQIRVTGRVVYQLQLAKYSVRYVRRDFLVSGRLCVKCLQPDIAKGNDHKQAPLSDSTTQRGFFKINLFWTSQTIQRLLFAALKPDHIFRRQVDVKGIQ